jgi:hypothetical protein
MLKSDDNNSPTTLCVHSSLLAEQKTGVNKKKKNIMLNVEGPFVRQLKNCSSKLYCEIVSCKVSWRAKGRGMTRYCQIYGIR